MRKPFTTSIDTEISDIFKKTCDSYDLKMNVVLEAFMKQFSEQQFKVEFSKSGIKLKIEDWKEKSPFFSRTGKFQKSKKLFPQQVEYIAFLIICQSTVKISQNKKRNIICTLKTEWCIADILLPLSGARKRDTNKQIVIRS